MGRAYFSLYGPYSYIDGSGLNSLLETVTLDSGDSGTRDFDVDLFSCYNFTQSTRGPQDSEISYTICDSGEMGATDSTTFCIIDAFGYCTVYSTSTSVPDYNSPSRVLWVNSTSTRAPDHDSPKRLPWVIKSQIFICCYFGLTIGLSWVFQKMFDRFSRPHKSECQSSLKVTAEEVHNKVISNELPSSCPGAVTEEVSTSDQTENGKTGCCAASCCARGLKPTKLTDHEYEKKVKLIKGNLYWDKGFWGDFVYYQANNHPFISLVCCSRLHPFSGNLRRLNFLITQAFCVSFTVLMYPNRYWYSDHPHSDDAVRSVVVQFFVVSPITLIMGKVIKLVYACGCLKKSRGTNCVEMLKKCTECIGWLIGAVFAIILILILTSMMAVSTFLKYEIAPDQFIRDILLSQVAQFIQSPLNDFLRLFWLPEILLKLKCIPAFESGRWRKERRQFLVKEGKGFVDDERTRSFLCLGTNEDVLTYATRNEGIGSKYKGLCISSTDEYKENDEVTASKEELVVGDTEDSSNDRTTGHEDEAVIGNVEDGKNDKAIAGEEEAVVGHVQD